MTSHESLARVDQVPPGAIYEVEWDGRPLLIVNLDGEFHAIDALCTHLEGPLSQGELIDGEITCPWHHSQFDVCTGAATKRPATRPLRHYEVTIESGEIRIART